MRIPQKAGKLTKPRPSSNSDLQGDLFKTQLETIINPDHPLVLLASQINWGLFEQTLGEHFCEHTGAPAKPVRLMVGLHYLKHNAECLKMPNRSRPSQESPETACRSTKHFE